MSYVVGGCNVHVVAILSITDMVCLECSNESESDNSSNGTSSDESSSC